jgi:hypothetical protein
MARNTVPLGDAFTVLDERATRFLSSSVFNASDRIRLILHGTY